MDRPPVAKSQSGFWNGSLIATLEQLSTTPDGLTAEEAVARRARYGPNDPAAERPAPAWRRLAGRFANPLVLMLLAASVIAGATGDLPSFVIIVTIVALSVAIDFIQESRAQDAITALRRTVAVTSSTLRDRAFTEIPVVDLVPGDILQLGAGDVVPADGRLVEANNLQIDQAILTGESFPVEKQAGDLAAPTEEVAAASNAAFAGASVVGGSGRLLVCATGRSSKLGEIAGALGGHKAPTAFQQGLNRFSALLMWIAMILVVVVLTESLALHRPWLEAVLFALALAVGLTPELLPMIVTVTLSRGAMRLSKKRVIVKQLASIHNLGAMDVLFTDKTGTLTEAKISVARHTDASGAESARALELALVNSTFQTGLKSPLDAAILAHDGGDLGGWRRIDEAPFDFRRRRVSVLAERDGARWLVVKGAPEDIIPRCDQVRDPHGTASGLDDAGHVALMDAFNAMGRQGERVLAIAARTMASDRAAITPDDESALTFEGFIAFLDPPKESAGAALATLRDRGVRIVILTGDNREVALHLCQSLNFVVEGVLDGREVDALTEEALTRRVAEVNVFCRVNPAQKLRILNAQKRSGRIVGFLGDGVNDAPALHAADVGLSVDSAADVAKAAAPIVLLDKDLGVLAEGVLEGRRTVRNVDKYVLMAGSANFGNICSMVLAGLFLPFLPLLPIQVLLTNLLYDLAQMGLPLDEVDEERVRKPVHWDIRLVERFMLVMGPISTVFDVMTFWVLLNVFHAGMDFFRSGWFIESLVTQVLMIFTVRTRRALWASRPHPLVAWLAVGITLATLALPFTPAGKLFQMVAPPAVYFAFLAVAVLGFLVAMEAAKQVFYARISPDRAR